MGRYDCVDSKLNRVFYTYGKFVYRHKLSFLLLSIVFILITMGGLYNFQIDNNVENIFTPVDSKSRIDLEILKEHFLTGKEGTDFIPNRELDIFIRRGTSIVTALDGGNLMRKEVLKEIIELDKRMKTFRLKVGSTTETYSSLCMRWRGQCIDNAWLMYLETNLEQSDVVVNMTFPFTDIGYQTYNLGHVLSRVTTYPETDVINQVKVMRLVHSLSIGTPERDEIGANWEDIYEEQVDKFQQDCKYIKVSRSTSRSLTQEAAEASSYVIPRFAATFGIMILFATFSCIMRDWVLSKPWLGFIGVLSAIFAIFTTVGIMSFVNIKFNQIAALMPFLVLGVGVDNMFIMISAWRHLGGFFTVEERMGKTFSKAAVSITITNLTDVLAFVVGATIRVPGVRIFCTYAGVAMIFVYIYQLTFFAACMAFIGDREANNLHCYTCKKVLPREEAPNKCYNIFCAGGMSKKTPQAIPLEHKITTFFHLIYGPFITKPAVKIIVIIGYIIYVVGAIYGCTKLTIGLELQSIARDESPAWIFYSEAGEYFTEFGASVSVVLRGPIKYWDENIQKRIMETQEDFQNNDFTFNDDRLTVSWIRDFQTYLKISNKETNVLDEIQFHKKLGKFVKDPRFSQYSLDLDLEKDENGTVVGIKASRFLVTTKNMTNSTRQSKMMVKMRELADNSEFLITVFERGFLIYEQYIGVLPNTFQTLGIAIVCMFLVTIIMIPHPICAVFVTICVISIDTAVIGYMSLWHIALNPISMLNIILCIGFSVDFSAHITYAFVIAPVEDPNLRSISALHNLGMPILQGALSTVTAIAVLSTAPVYIFRIFFKTLFLVIIFGAMHGLIVLPVCLSYVGKWIQYKTDRPERRYSSHSRRHVLHDSPKISMLYRGIPMCREENVDESFVLEHFVTTV